MGISTVSGFDLYLVDFKSWGFLDFGGSTFQWALMISCRFLFCFLFLCSVFLLIHDGALFSYQLVR